MQQKQDRNGTRKWNRPRIINDVTQAESETKGGVTEGKGYCKGLRKS